MAVFARSTARCGTSFLGPAVAISGLATYSWLRQRPLDNLRRAPSHRVYCESKQPSASKGLVTNWGDPKIAANLQAEYQKADVVASRKKIMALLNVALGEWILDIGCGPGYLMQELSHAVGASGRVEGLDPSEAMCSFAQARLADSCSPTSVKVGSADKLPYPDGSFDAVVFSQVLLYVPDVPGALKEARRVLRPGGRLLIMDTDWDSLIVHTFDKARFARIFEACVSTFVHAHLPPKLPGLLEEAGMPVTSVQTVAMVSAGTCEGSFMGNWAFKVVPEKAKKFGLPERDVNDWLQEQRALCDQKSFFGCLHRFLFLSVKP